MMNGNGQGQKLTNEDRERLNKRETIAHDDPTALSTAVGRQAQREEDRRAGRVPPSEAEDPVGGLAGHDEVEHPSHYTSHPSGIECIAIVEHMTFNVGNAVKYLWRAGRKTDDAIVDLRKAEWYVRREIQRLEQEAAT